MTGKPSKSGRGFHGSGYVERINLDRWSREPFRGSSTPRTTPLTQPELVKAVQVIERALLDNSRNVKQAEGLVSAYRDCLRKIDKP